MVLERYGGKDSLEFGVVYLVMDKNTGFLAMKTLQYQCKNTRIFFQNLFHQF